MFRARLNALPPMLWVLFGIYTLASLAHFVHNAQYIAFYPNLPGWITRESVYLAWLAVAGVGVTGVVVAVLGWPAVGAALIAAYGGLGLDGLAHYTLALCSQHTLGANLTIWFEVLAGSVLMVAAGRFAGKRFGSRRKARSAAVPLK